MKSSIKRWVLLFTCAALCALVAPALAENHLSLIDILVTLNKDGSARIEQTWQGDFTEGTECYLPIDDSGYLTLSDFRVTSDETSFETLDSWDTAASFEEKAARCGILRTEDGYELCWGITHYGSHTYQFSYTVHDIVRSYDEADGLHFMFVNPGMDTAPTDAVVRIVLADGTPLSSDNSAIWAFGFRGQIQFQDGEVIAWSEEAVTKNESVIVMLELEPGLLSPAMQVDGSFAQVRKHAMENADGSSFSRQDLYLLIGFLACVVLLAVFLVWRKIAHEKTLKAALARYGGLYTALPNEGRLEVSWRLGVLFRQCQESALIGALLMRLLRNGCLHQSADDPPEDKAFMTLRLVSPPQGDTLLAAFYALLESAADSGVLTASATKKYFYEHSDRLRAFLNQATQQADRWLDENGCFLGKTSKWRLRLTQSGERELGQLLGLKRLLTDETIDLQAQQITLPIEDCYAYALLLGLKDKALSRIRLFYPSAFSDYHMYEAYFLYSISYRNYTYNEMHRAETAYSSGKGGASFGGGGGGFSGGGGGGGTR